MAFSASSKNIYNVPRSGWTAPEFKWGYGDGTGHDCAAISRRTYATKQARSELVENLMNPADESSSATRVPENFEEVKLLLALEWQNGRWDGSDGGPGGYGDVLEAMASAKRYEVGSDDECSRRLVEDMQGRFSLLAPGNKDAEAMATVLDDCGSDVDKAQRRCCGLVLKAMGFAENGN